MPPARRYVAAACRSVFSAAKFSPKVNPAIFSAFSQYLSSWRGREADPSPKIDNVSRQQTATKRKKCRRKHTKYRRLFTASLVIKMRTGDYLLYFSRIGFRSLSNCSPAV